MKDFASGMSGKTFKEWLKNREEMKPYLKISKYAAPVRRLTEKEREMIKERILRYLESAINNVKSGKYKDALSLVNCVVSDLKKLI